MHDDAGIRLSGVTKSYTGTSASTTALDGVDLEVAPGRWTTIIGPSGCGKSTLLRLVAGLGVPDRGSVEVLGGSPRQATADKRIAYVPQSPALLPWRTALGNVMLPSQVNRGRGGDEQRSAARSRAVELLGDVGLAGEIDRYPSELSGGMQQRVAIARAFSVGAPVLIMDEPFSALDELTREILRYQLLELWQAHNATVLFVTHSVAEAVTLSDTVVVMSPRPGRIIGSIEVALMRPRPPGIEDTPEFHATQAAVRRLLRSGE